MPLDDYTPSLILNLLAPLSVVEKVAWFYVSVNDAMRMNVLQSKKQSLHILLNLLHSDMREVVLSKGTQRGAESSVKGDLCPLRHQSGEICDYCMHSELNTGVIEW